jgi:hypothetical protein
LVSHLKGRKEYGQWCIIQELQVRKEHSDGESHIIKSYITVLFIKPRRVRQEGHVACMVASKQLSKFNMRSRDHFEDRGRDRRTILTFWHRSFTFNSNKST